MRVVELREFLRRHQVSVRNVARNDGTPGPPRKSDLLAAALDVWKMHTSTQPDTAILQPTNPFQKRRSSPASLQRPRRSSVAAEQPEMPQTTSSALRASDSQPPSHPADAPSSTSRARRRSSSWVDPSLLAQLQAPSLSNQTNKTPAERNLVQSGRRDDERTRTASRTAPAPRSGPVLERVQTAFETPDDDGDDAVKLDSASFARPTSRRSVSTRLETPSTAQRRTRQSDVAPAPTRRTARERKLLDIEENYLSDEDPDYEADGEPAEYEDDSEASDYEHSHSADVIDLTYTTSQSNQQQAIHTVDDEIQPVQREGMHRVYKDAGEEDIPFDSDAYESDRVHHSDRGSVIDTEDEEQLVDFTQWRSKDLRDWLRAHNIQFPNLASKEELVGLVRARVLQMETMDEDQLPPVKQKSAHEPRKQEQQKLRSRRGITVPRVGDDDDEVIFVQEQSSRKSQAKIARSTESKNVRTVNGRRAQALTSFFVMSALLIVLWAFALHNIFLSARIPFCHNQSRSSTF
ncbi:hypothetical protein FGB62_117g026 [Gracilaria domingensis]|nr:hypothetical protein FGB62_117g026 [Gracilaria domingensis]